MRDWGYAYILNPECPPDRPYDYEEYKYRKGEGWATIKRRHCVPHYND